MRWDAVSAIGTILAALVGIAGIWINNWEKTRRLTIEFESVPDFKLLISNNSLRAVAITKMLCSIKDYVFYVEYYNGLDELHILPATIKTVLLDKESIYNSYQKHQLDALCNPADKVEVVLYDNYGRQYKIRTYFGISAFRSYA